jgi:hypothetical protein
MKVGIWEKKGSVTTLEEELKNGWDLVLGESDAGKPLRSGDGYQLFFKKAADKLPFYRALEELEWAAWGFNSYLLNGVPLEAIVKQLQRIIPTAEFFYVGTHEKF